MNLYRKGYTKYGHVQVVYSVIMQIRVSKHYCYWKLHRDNIYITEIDGYHHNWDRNRFGFLSSLNLSYIVGAAL